MLERSKQKLFLMETIILGCDSSHRIDCESNVSDAHKSSSDISAVVHTLTEAVKLSTANRFASVRVPPTSILVSLFWKRMRKTRQFSWQRETNERSFDGADVGKGDAVNKLIN